MLFFLDLFNISQVYVIWIFLAIGVVIGIILAYFIMNSTKLVIAIIGGYSGYILGIFLYQIVFIYIDSNSKVVYWVTIVVCLTICALLAIFITKHMLIIATCLIGGYAIIRGASLYIGHFPDEKIIMNLLANKEWEQLKGVILFFNF